MKLSVDRINIMLMLTLREQGWIQLLFLFRSVPSDAE